MKWTDGDGWVEWEGRWWLLEGGDDQDGTFKTSERERDKKWYC